MDRAFQLSVLQKKIAYAKSTDPNQVCKGINDIMSILTLLAIDDANLLEPLETAFEIADVALGIGELQLSSMYARQVENLIDDFADKVKGL